MLAFDAIGAAAAKAFDFDYGLLLPGSVAIYATTGFIAARVMGSAVAGLWGGGAVALVDSTLGWAISWVIGPGEPGDAGAASVAATVVLVTLSGAAVGWIAGAVATRHSVRR